MGSRGRRVTKKTLIIVPHMDDEVISCGGLIQQRLSDGWEVDILAVYGRVYDYGRESVAQSITREASHCLEALSCLGVPTDNVYYHNLTEGEPSQVGYYRVLELVESQLSTGGYQEVIIPSDKDLNQDHKFLNHVCRIALRPDNIRSVRRVLAFMGMDGNLRKANWYIPLSEVEIEKKIEALHCYETERRDGVHPRSPKNIRSFHAVHGSSIMVEYAEPYELIFFKEI